MRSISNRIYLDYNATSPLAEPVKEFLVKGDFPFGNPSSIHFDGKAARRVLRETKDYLFNLFDLDDRKWSLFFHSGATDGINSIIRGMHYKAIEKDVPFQLIYSNVDHSCVVKMAEEVELLGGSAKEFAVDKFGNFSEENLCELVQKGEGIKLLNYTEVNNETGLHWELDRAIKIKNETDCFIHVDAVQTVGKIATWNELNDHVDAYTFSAHKFGAMKGVGFSFIKSDLPFRATVVGGGQQEGLRSGTENVIGVATIPMALEEIKKVDYSALCDARTTFETLLKKEVQDKAIFIPQQDMARNCNTTCFVLPGVKASVVTTALDLANIEVSTGSACSAGTTVPSRVLLNMGFSKDDAKSVLRFSFSPFLSKDEAVSYADQVIPVLKRFI